MRTKLLYSLLDALCEGLAAHREYEGLTSIGVCHDHALIAALSETSHCREVCVRECRRGEKFDSGSARACADIGLTRLGFSRLFG